MSEQAAPKAAPKPKVSKPKKPVEHPGFTVMVTEAIAALKERTGSSGAAIKKYIGDKYKGKLPANWEKMTSMQLKRMADKGQLVKVKASYKLGEALKKPKKAPKAKKPAAAPKAKKAAPKKKVEGEKPKKKAAPKKKAEGAAKPKKAPTKAAGAAPKAKKPATKKPAAKKPAAAKKAPKVKKTGAKKATPKKAPAKKKAAAKPKA